MKQSLFYLSLLAFFAAQCTHETPKTTADATPPATVAVPDLVQRGEYLVTIAGCEDCHSPKIMTDRGPAPDPKLRLSGHPAQLPLPAITDKKMAAPGQWVLFHPMNTAAVGPWGTSYAANLTPDDTGMGYWTYEQFKKALTEGKAKGMDGGRMLLPPMPWPNYVGMSEADLSAIYAYLKSIPPIHNVVPAPVPPTVQ